jgi:hypothetical protein
LGPRARAAALRQRARRSEGTGCGRCRRAARRPNRLVTEANGYTSRNAHRLSIGLDTPFFVDGELYTPQSGTPLTLTDAGAREFLTLR